MLRQKESNPHSSPPGIGSSFLAPNGIHNPYDFSATELVSINNCKSSSSTTSAHYTSLKDILPAAPSPPSGFSPTQNSSWHEIPIRNPLLKHAARAYLQPMSAPPESGHTCFFSKLNSVCCFEYFMESILKIFLHRRDSDYDFDDYCYCGAGGKVD